MIVDTCYSGAGIPDATSVAATLMEAYPPQGKRVWVGVLASTSGTDTAVDGKLGRLVARLLSLGVGPRDPHVRRRWSAYSPRLRGDDLCDAVLKDWPDPDRRPRFRSDGNAWWMFPNPLYRPGTPRQVVEHLLRAARGGTEERSWFTGRTGEVNTIVGWVSAAQPGVYVVTGSPGTGKSAVVGRVVSLSDPDERARLYEHGRNWAHDDPEPGAVHGHAHARALTVDRLANLLDDHLGGAVLERAEHPRNAELVGAIQRAVQDGLARPVLVVDGLDEARGEAFTIAEDLLVRLGRWATVIVSTRPTPGDEQTLVEALGPATVLDLDAPAAREAGRVALRGYVEARLAETGAALMDPTLVATHILGSTSGGDRPFLLARVLTDQLRAHPVDTTQPGWAQAIAISIESAFDTDLQRVGPLGHRDLPADLPVVGFARHLLVALTWAFGAGFPEAEWRAAATALAGVPVDAADISWVLDQLGRYVLQDGEGGVGVYRIAHQALADHLRPPFRSSAATMFDPAAEPVTTALLGRYRALVQAGRTAREPEYLWRYAHRHAAQLAEPGIQALIELAQLDPDLQIDVALASEEVGHRRRFWGDRGGSLVHAERAEAIYRALAADNPPTSPTSPAP